MGEHPLELTQDLWEAYRLNSSGQMRIMNAALHSVCHDLSYGQFVSASAARLVG